MKNNTLHKIWNILDSVQRKNTIKILFLVVIGAFLEMISIGLIFPVVSIFIKSSNSIEEPPETIPLFMDIAHEVFGNNDFYIILSILISAFIFKNIFLSYSVVRQSKHVFNVSSNLSVKLFYIYLHKPFIDLIKYDSSTIIRNIVNEINVLTNSGLLAGLSLIVELFVLVGLFVLLAVISPIGVLLITSIVGGSAYIFYMITKKMSRKYGKRRQYYEGQRIKNVKQAFLGIKEIKLNMHEVITIDEYRKNCLAVSRAASNHHILQQLPRLWLEFFIVIALSLSLLVIVLSNQNPINFIPVIGVFSAAAFRLIPSFNKILNSASSQYNISVEQDRSSTPSIAGKIESVVSGLQAIISSSEDLGVVGDIMGRLSNLKDKMEDSEQVQQIQNVIDLASEKLSIPVITLEGIDLSRLDFSSFSVLNTLDFGDVGTSQFDLSSLRNLTGADTPVEEDVDPEKAETFERFEEKEAETPGKVAEFKDLGGE